MYSQSARGIARRGKGGKWGGDRRKQGSRDRTRLIQFGVCLVLFLTVFIGKGVFPQRVRQAGQQLLSLISCNTDFRGAFAELGQSLSGQESLLGQIGDFCVDVFGIKTDIDVPSLALSGSQVAEEQQFLNGTPSQAALTAHYLHLDQVPEEWLKSEQAETTQQTQEEDAVPAVGTVILSAEYEGPELPVGYTMDQLSLGGLETTTPVMGTLWSEYGYREHPINGTYTFHNGVDLGADMGVEIGAFADGTVEYIGEDDSYGLYVQIDHGNGIKSFYAHCSQIFVSQGQTVSLGECIALVGSTGSATGPHLHFELKCNGIHIDPAYYIQYNTP